MKKAAQLTFTDYRMTRGRGGPRRGAGRPAIARPIVHHVKRPDFSDVAAHVTVRVLKDVPSLRSRRFVREFKRSLREACDREGFRVVQYSLQSDHAHLIVEAASKVSLGCGMKAVAARLARAANRVFGRSERVLAGRYHLRVLETAREVRNVIAYVLLNSRNHGSKSRGEVPPVGLDAASSGRWFDGWLVKIPGFNADPGLREVASARSWLVTTGWRRWGLIDPAEVPGTRKRGRALD